jgi:hypothetical protein
MFGLFKKRHERIEIKGNDIYIDNQKENIGKPVEISVVLKFTKETPEINFFENQVLYRSFRIDTLKKNPNLKGQFLHCSIRIFANSGVMIDGIISKSETTYSEWTDSEYEALRLQPFYLSDKNENNIRLKGKGLFERGLHFSGTVTPSGVRNICTCDNCKSSFTLQHFHAGLSEVQYFYSSDSKETLVVPYTAIENLPTQLQATIDPFIIELIETQLPKPTTNNTTFKYYNSLKCPHCLTTFIDFENNNQIRPNEYYGNNYINEKPILWTK